MAIILATQTAWLEKFKIQENVLKLLTVSQKDSKIKILNSLVASNPNIQTNIANLEKAKQANTV